MFFIIARETLSLSSLSSSLHSFSLRSISRRIGCARVQYGIHSICNIFHSLTILHSSTHTVVGTLYCTYLLLRSAQKCTLWYDFFEIQKLKRNLENSFVRIFSALGLLLLLMLLMLMLCCSTLFNFCWIPKKPCILTFYCECKVAKWRYSRFQQIRSHSGIPRVRIHGNEWRMGKELEQ